MLNNRENSASASTDGTAIEKTKKANEQPLELRDVKTPRMLKNYLIQKKVKDMSSALIYSFIYSQTPENCIYVLQPSGVDLGLLQRVSKILNEVDYGEDLEKLSMIRFKYGKQNFIFTKNNTEEKKEIEELQSITGGVSSDTVNDIGTIRIIYLADGYNEKPVASDCSLYEMLK